MRCPLSRPTEEGAVNTLPDAGEHVLRREDRAGRVDGDIFFFFFSCQRKREREPAGCEIVQKEPIFRAKQRGLPPAPSRPEYRRQQEKHMTTRPAEMGRKMGDFARGLPLMCAAKPKSGTAQSCKRHAPQPLPHCYPRQHRADTLKKCHKCPTVASYQRPVTVANGAARPK